MKLRFVIVAVGLAALGLAAACGAPGRTLSASSAARKPAISPSDPLYDRVEAPKLANACAVDADCVRGGCSLEVCSADKNVVTTCDAIAWPPAGASCGCVDGACVWYEEQPANAAP